MDEIDHLANRVTATFATGCLLGICVGTYRGQSPISLALLRTAFTTASSCALAGTACFGFERIVHIGLAGGIGTSSSSSWSRNDWDMDSDSSGGKKDTSHNHEQNETEASKNDERWKRRLASHAAGGAAGGALLGQLYRGGAVAKRSSSLSGALLFAPLMMGVAWGEEALDQYRRDRWMALVREAQSLDDGDKIVVEEEDGTMKGSDDLSR